MNNFQAEIYDFFTNEEINELAKQTKFVRREHPGRIDGEIFLSLIVFQNENLKAQSLNDLSGILLSDRDVLISPSGLNRRFNEYAVCFLAKILETV